MFYCSLAVYLDIIRGHIRNVIYCSRLRCSKVLNAVAVTARSPGSDAQQVSVYISGQYYQAGWRGSGREAVFSHAQKQERRAASNILQATIGKCGDSGGQYSARKVLIASSYVSSTTEFRQRTATRAERQ
jgi:hypothetical protein